jgi:type IV fimbrial biogenesis protein FimT
MKKFRQQGFTVLELMITLVIAGILMGIGVPSMLQFIKNDRLTSYRNTLFTDLIQARSTSVQLNQPVTVCVSSNGTSCTSGSFQDGWIIANDSNNNGVIESTELIKVQQAIQNDVNFFSSLTSITFDSRGFSPNSRGSISVCDSRGIDFGQVITISVTGRVGRGGNPTCS